MCHSGYVYCKRKTRLQTNIQILGIPYPLGQFGLVHTDDDLEYFPFMVTYFSDWNNKLNTIPVRKPSRDHRIRRSHRSNKYEVVSEE